MRCAKCQAENLADSLFCTECGAKMEVSCAACGWSNPAAAKFCRRCGASLSEPAALPFAAPSPGAPPGLAPAAPGPAEVGERRQLTVLFCDLVGSTPLSQQLDAEECRDLIGSTSRIRVHPRILRQGAGGNGQRLIPGGLCELGR